MKSSIRRHAAMAAGGMDGCQGTPRNEELDCKELHGVADCDLGPRESAVSCTSSTWRQGINSTSIYKSGTMLFLGGSVSFVFFLLPDCLFPRELLCFRAFRHVIFERNLRLITRA